MKLNLLQKNLQKTKTDYAFFFTNEGIEPNFTYFTQLNLSHSILIVPSSGKPTIITSSMESTKAKKGKVKNIITPNKPFLEYLSKNFSTTKIALDFSNINLHLFQKVKGKFPKSKFNNIHNFTSKLRIQKTQYEIKTINQACKITDNAFKHIIDNFNFKTENELKAAINQKMEKYGAEQAFPTIVASGPNAAIPHHIPSNKKLNSFCIIDFGAV